MKYIRLIAVSENAPTTDTVWVKDGKALYFSKGQWREIGKAEDIEKITWDNLQGKPELATVATSGSYNDLKDKPTAPAPYKLPSATTSTLGGVLMGQKMAPLASDADLPATVATLNLLIENLKTVGIINK